MVADVVGEFGMGEEVWGWELGKLVWWWAQSERRKAERLEWEGGAVLKGIGEAFGPA